MDADAAEASLAELARLVTTLGYEVAARVLQSRGSLSPAAVLGEGKLKELARLTGGSGNTRPIIPGARRSAADDDAEDEFEPEEDDYEEEEEDGDEDGASPREIALVAVDHDISPSQLRNLERATGVTVLDRTGVIIEIFHRHAKSREARLQVEIARLNYEAPRLRESPKSKERQAGRGAGEAALELDRRKIRDRIAELRRELAAVVREQDVRRQHRRGARRVALVGYTNAGKSSLMRALTSSEVYVEDKLFATLDTTVRALSPEAKPRVLVSDTVGFIKKLPHDLVASFKSTLDEALEASLLLHVVDASDPGFREQLEVTRDVLREIGAEGVPHRLVMNKVDQLSAEAIAALQQELPDAWYISAKNPEDVKEVRARIIGFFESRYAEAELSVPYAQQRLVSEMHEQGRVVSERYEEDGVKVRLRSDPEVLDSFRAKLARLSATDTLG
ncbi:MAG: GTP-binding protein related to HflX [Polyangiaceae bacterium]|nr:GTP-binding protein related to HflX [Polyangiaceae bacterium]